MPHQLKQVSGRWDPGFVFSFSFLSFFFNSLRQCDNYYPSSCSLSYSFISTPRTYNKKFRTVTTQMLWIGCLCPPEFIH